MMRLRYSLWARILVVLVAVSLVGFYLIRR
jgi:hypothetical protein